MELKVKRKKFRSDGQAANEIATYIVKWNSICKEQSTTELSINNTVCIKEIFSELRESETRRMVLPTRYVCFTCQWITTSQAAKSWCVHHVHSFHSFVLD